MKKILSIVVILFLCMTASVFAQETSKTYCISGVEYSGSLDGLKTELLAAAKAEMAIVAEFLPAELTDAELETIVREAVAETGAAGPGDMGKVMKAVMPRTTGRADGSRVSALVKQVLAV